MGGQHSRFLSKKDVSLIMVGLDGAGKTTILQKVRDEVDRIQPPLIPNTPFTSGLNISTIGFREMYFTIWDLPGGNKLKPMWKQPFSRTQAVIFVVDSSNRERIAEAREELHRMLEENYLRNAVLLVFANKKDLPNAMTVSEITDNLNLHDLGKRTWTIEATSATTGDGLFRGMDWLTNHFQGGGEHSHSISGLLGKKPKEVLMVGLRSCGKTTVLYKLKAGEIVTRIPMRRGPNVEEIEYRKVQFKIADLGESMKLLWGYYFRKPQAIMFVVDANDRGRITTAREELHRLLDHQELRSAVLIVLANKVDLPNAMSVREIPEKLGLYGLKERSWTVQATCAVTGDGLYESLDWLTRSIPK